MKPRPRTPSESIRPHDLLGEVLPPIPPSIKTREDYYCDTTGLIWRMSPTLNCGHFDWNLISTTPRMLVSRRLACVK